MIVGDFNAHIAEVGCNPVSNSQGLALRDLVERNNLFVAPLDKGHTYCSGHTRTTVDYIIVNQCASYLMTTSEVLDNHPLNTSAVCAVNPIRTWKDIPRVNWGKAPMDQPGIEEYQRAIDGMIRPLIGKTYDSTAKVEEEVNLVMTGVCKFATQLLPLHKKNTSKNTSKKLFCDHKSSSLRMKLQTDDRTITDKEDLVYVWENHFSSLSKSRIMMSSPCKGK